VSALYLFVYASDYPKTASHGRVAPDHKLFGPMLHLFVYASDYPKTASHGRVAPDHKLFGPML
jgi:hypothetical protein